MEILKLENITKVYNTKSENIDILKNINLSLEKGDLVSIVGKSGSGKTTLLNIIGLLDAPTSGKVYIDGKEVNFKDSNTRNKSLGFIFQFHHLLKEFTALENVMLPAMINKYNKKELEKRATDLLDLVGIKHRLNHKPDELSGGEKQRVAIARALINNPKIILADEPTGNLDYSTSKLINNLFLKINKELNQTIIIVTHSKDLSDITNKKYIIENSILKEIK